MIYTPLTMKAMDFAYNAHHWQTDHAGVPYIFHPYHLAEQMDDEISCAAALLHDVVEDTAVTLDDLRQEFPEAVVEAVALLTHDDSVDYFDYVKSIRRHPIAKKVKIADLTHNSNQSRCTGSGISPEQLRYWEEKYQKATVILNGGEPDA